eukprot:353444-Chlamydomonas_euryale.AAC.4
MRKFCGGGGQRARCTETRACSCQRSCRRGGRKPSVRARRGDKKCDGLLRLPTPAPSPNHPLPASSPPLFSALTSRPS